MILNLVRSVTSAGSLRGVELAPFMEVGDQRFRVGARRLGRRRHNDLALGAGLAVDNRDRHAARRATAIGSPPERSSAVTAQNTNAPKNRPSATAIIFAAETSVAWRCLLGSCPSGAVRFFIVMRDPVPDQRVRFRPNPQPRAIRESRQRAYHGISAASRSAGPRLAGICGETTKNRGGTWPPRSSLCLTLNWRLIDQFGTAAFGFGGNAALLAVPRNRSSAILIALSSDSFGGT